MQSRVATGRDFTEPLQKDVRRNSDLHEMGKNQVIVQFKAESPRELDRLFQIEETLFQAFSQCNDGVVDGHDVGQGRFNIYIHSRRSWGPVLERVKAFLKLRGALGDAVIVKFHGKTQRYEVVHPATHPGGFVL